MIEVLYFAMAGFFFALVILGYQSYVHWYDPNLNINAAIAYALVIITMIGAMSNLALGLRQLVIRGWDSGRA